MEWIHNSKQDTVYTFFVQSKNLSLIEIQTEIQSIGLQYSEIGCDVVNFCHPYKIQKYNGLSLSLSHNNQTKQANVPSPPDAIIIPSGL